MAKCVECKENFEQNQASERKKVPHPRRVGKMVLQALYWPGRFLGKCKTCGQK